jgi:hypothetical protein
MDARVIDMLDLPSMLHRMADTLLYKIHTAESAEQLDWVHGRAEGFALGLSFSDSVTPWQSDYLMTVYTAAREQRQDELQAQGRRKLDISPFRLIGHAKLGPEMPEGCFPQTAATTARNLEVVPAHDESKSIGTVDDPIRRLPISRQ